VKARVRAYEQITAAAVWREAFAIIRQYPLAMIVPAIVDGALSTEFFKSGHKAPQLQGTYARPSSPVRKALTTSLLYYAASETW
jgi:hypothetical protein